MKLINLPVAMENIKKVIKLQEQKLFKTTPILQGLPGIGKTSFMNKLAKDLGFHLYNVSGAKPMEYFSGIPITDRAISENNEVGRAIWTQPEMIGKANALSKTKPVILFIDDIHLIGEASDYLFELLLEKSLNNHKLNDNVFIVGASNNSSLSGYEGFPAAIINRMMIIPVELEFSTWYKNVGIGLNTYVTTFMKTHPEFINEPENTSSPFGTYRSWTELAVLLNEMYKGLDNNGILEVTEDFSQSFVSNSSTLAFKTSILTQQKFNFESMLKSTKKIPKPKKGIVEQVIFSNVVKYCKSAKHFDKLKVLLEDTTKTDEYSSFTLNTVLEVISLLDYTKKTEPKSKSIPLIEDLLVDISMNDKLSDTVLKYG